MASSVQEKDIKKVWAAGYLAKKIGHCLPMAGQIVPAPEPHERVVFLPHFVRGLGFPLHPFVRGIMYYYGIDFHDLSPNSVLNILTFIVVCEAFLRIPPHFGLWLKIFNVKPKVVNDEHAECGGAMVSRMPKVTWSRVLLMTPSRIGSSSGSTSPSRVAKNGSLLLSFDLEPICGSRPGPKRA